MWGLSVREIFDIHDWEYGEGGDDIRRLIADVHMLVNGHLLIEKRTTKVWVVGHFLRWLRGIRLNTYYRAVRDFGFSAFRYS